MSLELTARLTLSSCVSQLTDFFVTDIMPTIVEIGYQRLIIRLCDGSGELYPYIIDLTPALADGTYYGLESIQAFVLVADGNDTDRPFNIRASFTFERSSMSVSGLYKCALHVCGDFIKFNEKGN